MIEIEAKHYPLLSKDMERSAYEYWYGSPELWCCQDYPIFYDNFRLMNEDSVLLIPPLVQEQHLTMSLNEHCKRMKGCDILFAPHYIEHIIHPLVFRSFKVEQVDNNYINSTEKVLGLRGNKFKKLRNNVNNFGRELVNRPLSRSDIPLAIELCEKYRFQSKEFNDLDYNTKMLQNLARFDLIHRGYWEGDEMVAFNIGAPLSKTTVSFIISKSKHDIKYLVDYVRHDFHADCFVRGYSFVNDGGDLDSEGLAQLKRKFAPVDILPVYSMEWKG